MARPTPRAEAEEVIASLVGRTVTAVEWCDEMGDDGDEWGERDYALLTLDDGRVVRFGGWGYDAWGLTVEVVDP